MQSSVPMSRHSTRAGTILTRGLTSRVAERLRAMAAPDPGSYHGVNQTAGMSRPWWGPFPHPIVTAAVTIWSLLPHALRRPLLPFARLFNPHQTTAAIGAEGPDSVDGVADLRAQGFEPIEEHTGAIEVAQLWPEDHRRWVSETREAWLDDTNYDGR